MRLALVALISALGLAAAQPALAGDGPDPKLGSAIAACKGDGVSTDALKACVKSRLGLGEGVKQGVEPGDVVQSLCKGRLGTKLGAGCVQKLTTLLASCKRTAGDGWKECVKAQLGRTDGVDTKPAAPVFDPSRMAQALCQGPLAAKLGADCATKVAAALAVCKGRASAVGDVFKACVAAQLPLDLPS